MTTQDSDKKQFVPETLSLYSWEGERLYLTLNLPESSKELDNFYFNNEYDFDVPDALIRIDVQRMIDALDVLQRHPMAFQHVGIYCEIDSEGYQGKLRGSHILIYPANIDGRFYPSMYAGFYNDWSSTHYELDITPFLPCPAQSLHQYLTDLVDQQVV